LSERINKIANRTLMHPLRAPQHRFTGAGRRKERGKKAESCSSRPYINDPRFVSNLLRTTMNRNSTVTKPLNFKPKPFQRGQQRNRILTRRDIVNNRASRPERRSDQSPIREAL
jgi:hypothetical protein